MKREILKAKNIKEDETNKFMRFATTNFECLYDSFHEPLAEAILDEGEIIGIDQKGEIKQFMHTEESRSIEFELSKYTVARDSGKLESKLDEYLGRQSAGDALNYILLFYKGVSEYLKGNYDEAEMRFQSCLNLFDGDAQLYYNLGLAYMM